MRELSLSSLPPQKLRWTRPESNRHLHRDRELCCQLHHGPAAPVYHKRIYLSSNLPPPRGIALVVLGAAGQKQIPEHGDEAGSVIEMIAPFVSQHALHHDHDDGEEQGNARRNPQPICTEHHNPHSANDNRAVLRPTIQRLSRFTESTRYTSTQNGELGAHERASRKNDCSDCMQTAQGSPALT